MYKTTIAESFQNIAGNTDFGSYNKSEAVIVAPAPQGEELSEYYTLRVDRKDVPVYTCRVSAMPFNQVWPGYQRPLDQTELAGFAYWAMKGRVRIEIESQRSVQSVVVRPGNLKIKPVVRGNRIIFDLDRPRQVVVEVNGAHHALHLFGNPPETDVPSQNTPGVRYFGPGVHQPGKITMESGQTLYIAPGAVVYGSINATGAKNIRIMGRGILDVSPYERGKGGGAVRLSDCSGVVIDGIIMRDPDVWCCSLFGCRDASINNVKLVGLWRYNADGIDICNSQDVEVTGSFVRSFDDALVIKGLKSFDDRPVRNVRFSDCTVWCDWGMALEIGAETCTPGISGVVFENCSIMRSTSTAMDIQHGDRATIRDIRYENIYVEMDELNLRPRLQKQRDERYDAVPENYMPRLLSVNIRGNNYSRDTQRGTIEKILFRNISVAAPRMPESFLSGFDAEHGITGVIIEGISLNGQQVANAAAAKLSIGKFVSEVQFSVPDTVKNSSWRSGCPLPSMATWFWREEQFKLGGYKTFIDQIALHSPYDLVSVSVRLPGREITGDAVHDQIKLAVEYAAKYGISVAADLDVRAARRAFESKYPDELQEMLLLKEITMTADEEMATTVKSIDLSDHYTGSATHYIPLYGKLTRVYSYNSGDEGIDPQTLEDITRNCVVMASSKDSVRVKIPAQKNNSRACVMVSFTLLAPDVFAPHLMEFQRELIRNYADIPLAGVFKDEWGFPPCFDGSPQKDQYWYSRFRAEAYAGRTNNRDLLADCLQMYRGFKGKEQERQRIINHFMEMSWQRNGALEEDYYHAVKDIFGPGAVVLTHPTWWPYPDLREYMKNGLDWWAATRDWAQTDETTPFPVRTSLAKKWGSPVWYNMYYATRKSEYEQSVWSSVLAGGRINYHPLYPSELKGSERYLELFRGGLMRAESRVRLLNFISQSPLDCPVAVVFGHACTMNWAGPSYDDPGIGLANALWLQGIPADLIPTDEITLGNLTIDSDGWIRYGAQRYSAVILYHPEFENSSTADFFNHAARGKTRLFRMGAWTRDFEAREYDGNKALPAGMTISASKEQMVNDIKKILPEKKVITQTPSVTGNMEIFGHSFVSPPAAGFCRLTDGTTIFVSGRDQVSGDPVKPEIKIRGVSFEAIGVVGVRTDGKGDVEAMAAGGLKSFSSRNLKIFLDEPVDLALWKSPDGTWEGVIQGKEGPLPRQLLKITTNWKSIREPVPFTGK